MVKREFGSAGDQILIEERLAGYEVSLLAICSGKDILALAPAQDYKRIGDGDTGPNTGGMGNYSPVPELFTGVGTICHRKSHHPYFKLGSFYRCALRRADDYGKRATSAGI